MSKINTEYFDLLYKKYSIGLYKYIYTYVHNKEDSEDILQDVFICLLNTGSKFKTDDEYYYWLIRVSKNKALNFLRKNKRVVKTDLITSFSYKSQDDSYDDDSKMLFKLVQELDEKYKDVIVLHFYNDLKIEEISSILNISLSAVKMRIKRAKEMLKNKMESNKNV